MIFAPDFARRLCARMAERGVTVRQLAEMSGVATSTINDWRRGRQTRVRVDKVECVADALDGAVEELLDLRAEALAPDAPRRPPPPRRAAADDQAQVALRETAGELRESAPDLIAVLGRHREQLDRLIELLSDLPQQESEQ